MLKRYILGLVLLCVVLAPGCARMKYNYTPEVQKIDKPEIGVQSRAYVGEAILSQGHKGQSKYLNLRIPVMGNCYDIPKGQYSMTGVDNERYFFAPAGAQGSVQKSMFCDPVRGLSVAKNNPSEVCVVTVFGAHACYPASFSVENAESDSMHDNLKTLSYMGIQGGKAVFAYSERKAGSAPLSQEFTRSAEGLTILDYRGAKIQIHSISSEGIAYTVLQRFSAN